MNIPYKKDLLHSTIDYEKLIKMQSEGFSEINNSIEKQKSIVKSKSYEKRIHRGGKND